MLYHYTSSDAIINILNKDGIHFRLSRYDCLNDMSEGKVAIEIQNLVCAELEKEFPQEKHTLDKISKMRPDFKTFFIKTYPNNDSDKPSIKLRIFHKVATPYILSFSELNDSLPLWNYYLKNQQYEGYNIGLGVIGKKISILNSQMTPVDILFGYEFKEIIYNENMQKELVKNTIINIINSSETFNADEYMSHLNEWSMQFKKSVFKHEKETRLICYLPSEILDDDFKDNVIKFKSIHGMIIPYIEMLINDKSVLKTITIAPLVRSDIAQKTLKLFLDENEYDDVVVKKSELPIRY